MYVTKEDIIVCNQEKLWQAPNQGEYNRYATKKNYGRLVTKNDIIDLQPRKIMGGS